VEERIWEAMEKRWAFNTNNPAVLHPPAAHRFGSDAEALDFYHFHPKYTNLLNTLISLTAEQ
jgi:hypothetical protein